MKLVATAFAMVLAALPAFAQAATPLSQHDITTRIGDIKAANGLAPKEINQNCGLVAPLPTIPTGPTYTTTVNDVFLGQQFARFRMTAWRKACPNNDSQLMLTLEPTAGTTQLGDLFTVRQGSRNFNTILVSDAAGALANYTLSGRVTYLVKFIGDASATFDDDAAFSLRYLGLGSGASLDIPAVAGAGPATLKVGDWFDGAYTFPQHSGQGYLLDVDARAGVVSGAWFTANREGRRDWFTFLGVLEGTTARITLYRTDNVRLLEPANVANVEIGTGEIEFRSCTEIRFHRESPFLQIGGYLDLVKLTQPDLDCRQ